MNCPEWEDRIALSGEGDLPPNEVAETERHLAHCASCREFAEGLAQSLAIARAAHTSPIPPAAFTALRARVLEQIAREPRPSRRFAWIVPLIAAAAVAIVLLLPRPVEPIRGAGDLVAGDSHRQDRRPNGHTTSPPAPLLDQALAPATAQPIAPKRPPRVRRRPKPQPPAEPLMVKLVTDDPNVIIYWIPN